MKLLIVSLLRISSSRFKKKLLSIQKLILSVSSMWSFSHWQIDTRRKGWKHLSMKFILFDEHRLRVLFNINDVMLVQPSLAVSARRLLMNSICVQFCCLGHLLMAPKCSECEWKSVFFTHAEVNLEVFCYVFLI